MLRGALHFSIGMEPVSGTAFGKYVNEIEKVSGFAEAMRRQRGSHPGQTPITISIGEKILNLNLLLTNMN